MAGLRLRHWDIEREDSKVVSLVDLSTVADAEISNPPWVKFQSAGWVNFPSAPTAFNSSRDAVALMMGGGGAALGQMLIPVPILGALLGNLVGSTIGAVGFSYANNKVLGICVESGWTFWGLVDQSYVVPEHVLREAGFDLFAPQYFKPELFAVNKFNVQHFKTYRNGFTFVRRGVIAFNAVGYQ